MSNLIAHRLKRFGILAEEIDVVCMLNLPLSGLDGGTSRPFCYGFVPAIGWQPQQNHPIFNEPCTNSLDNARNYRRKKARHCTGLKFGCCCFFGYIFHLDLLSVEELSQGYREDVVDYLHLCHVNSFFDSGLTLNGSPQFAIGLPFLR